jgi:hypothetical protein
MYLNSAQFDSVFSILIAALVEKIKNQLDLSDQKALEELYNSPLYKLLEREETKFWQYSTEKLFELFKEQKETNHMTYPQI